MRLKKRGKQGYIIEEIYIALLCTMHATSHKSAKQHASHFLDSDNLSLKFQALPGSVTFYQVPEVGIHSFSNIHSVPRRDV